MSDEDRAKQPMTEAEMLQMPKYVAENRRCACPEDDCNYVTVDTFMLVSFLMKEIANILENYILKGLVQLVLSLYSGWGFLSSL